MDEDLARHLARMAFRLARELQDEMAFLRGQLPADHYKSRAIAIADAIHTINTALLEPALAAFPGLQAEIDLSIERCGRYL